MHLVGFTVEILQGPFLSARCETRNNQGALRCSPLTVNHTSAADRYLSKRVTLKNVRNVLVIYWLFTLEDSMYKVGRLLLRATVGFLLLYRQAISPSSTAHLHSVTPNQRLKSHLHCHSIFRAQVRMDTISPTIGIQSANCIVAHDHKKVDTNMPPEVKHQTYN